MKYGDSLRQHSVPEWAYYNVDYDAVKHLIKECTSASKGKAIAIPGQDDDVAVNTEQRLYSVLLSEHERVGLFVKSKSNEIQGRLSGIERTLRKLRSRNITTGSDAPPYLLGRYGKLEREAISTGEQIRALSRFIAAQRTAFRKLLKKYKKWSDSPMIDERFRAEVLSRPSSFTNISMGESFDRWTDLLQIIRAARISGGAVEIPPLQTSTVRVPSQTPSNRTYQQSSASVAQQLDQAINTVNDVNFDTAFSEIPIGESGSRAVYWVHPEQLIELQVLLLQQLRLFLTKQTMETPTSYSQSPIISRRSSVSTRVDGSAERESDSGVIYLDNADDYGLRQSRITVGESEGSLARSAAAARWTSSTDEATLALRVEGASFEQGLARIRRKHLGAFLDAERDFKPWQSLGKAALKNGSLAGFTQETMSPDEARSILEINRRLVPLVAILCKRTRFVGLGNGPTAGQWAMLDTQICYNKVPRESLAGKDWTTNLSRDANEFPFAILRVRQEGNFAKDLIDLLDKSHLTERVRGFSLSSHAFYECWKPRGMSPPFWLPALSKDIRKVPERITFGRRKSSLVSGAEQGQISSASSNSENDRSGSSTAVADSSATSVPTTPMLERDLGRGLSSIAEAKPMKKVRLEEPALDRPSRKKRKEETRYWNEYDNPSDDEGNAYYIYIDPDKEDKWFGQETAERLYDKFNTLFSGEKKAVPDEERALLRPLTEYEDESISASPTDSEAESPVKSTFFTLVHGTKRNNYGTNGPKAQNGHGKRSTRLTDLMLPPVETAATPSTSSRLLITAISLAASSILCVLEIILASTGRRKQRGEVDAGILIGVIASLFFALVGVTSVLTSREKIPILSWIIIGITFCAVCVADGVLIGWVLA